MIVSDVSDPAAVEREVRAALAAERKADRVRAKTFADACRDGDVDLMLRAVDFLHENTIEGWRHAMRQVGRLPAVRPEIRTAFVEIWIEAKHLPLAVGHRPTMAKALRALMPPVALTEPLRLYRGTTASEQQRRLYGFSWTTHREIVERFADQARQGSGGALLLETVVEPGTVHLKREDKGYYDESEVVVDPYRLGKIRVLARLPSAREP